MSLLAFSLARRIRWSAVRAPGLLSTLLASLAALLLLASPADAAPELTLRSGDLLSPVETSVQMRLAGQLDSPWPDVRLRVEVTGPQAPGAPVGDRPVAGSFEQDLGELPNEWQREFSVPAELMTTPGGYRVTASISSGPDSTLSASAWLGRVPAAPQSVDLATVWPLALGVQRDPEGVFIDDTVERAVTPEAAAEGSLYAFFSLPQDHPEWHFTLAVEPLLLTQIEDMGDGFRRRDGQEIREVSQNDTAAGFASQALTTFRSVAAVEAVQVIPMPFASPHLALLGAEDWDDGLEQMHLGKAQLLEQLQLTSSPDAAYPPGLELTTESLGYLSGASIDYALAGAETAQGLAELPENGEGAVRVRDADNNRLTLLFVNPELRAALGPDWDAGLFFAALASELGAGKRGPLIVAPAQDYGPAPASFLDLLGDEFDQNGWLRTRTLAEVLRSHPPSARPIFLSRYASDVEGFVGESLAARLRQSHLLLEDYLAAADPDRAPIDRLKLLIYQAESRYWFARGADPQVANMGLSYLDAADRLVREEFDKVDVAADKSVIIMGDEGEVPVAVINRTGYPLNVTLSVEGTGLRLDGEASRTITLGPQENIVRLPVRLVRGSASVRVAVLSGSSRLDEEVVEVRAVSLSSVLPWLVGLGLLVAAGVALLLRRRSKIAQA